jgi:stringent starvation protein B
MVPLKPYFVRAVFDWAVDNGFTPHILVNAEYPGVVVPTGYVENGQIVLNIHPQATHGLQLGDETLSFSARFGGQPLAVTVPLGAVLGVFARENGEGVTFPEETPGPETPPPSSTEGGSEGDRPQGPPSLKVVK